MRAQLAALLAPPRIDDPETRRAAEVLNRALLSALAAVTLLTGSFAFLAAPGPDRSNGLFLGGGATLFLLVLHQMLRRGRVGSVSRLLVALLMILLTARIGAIGTVASPMTMTYVPIIILAGLLLGGRATLLTALLAVTAVGALAAAESGGLIVAPRVTIGPMHWLTLVVNCALTAALIGFTMGSIAAEYRRALRNEEEVVARNAELQRASDDLETRIRRRTHILETSSLVARSLCELLDERELLGELERALELTLGYACAQLYLLDPDGRTLALRGGVGELTATLLEQGFNLTVGEAVPGRAAAERRLLYVADLQSERDDAPEGLPAEGAVVAVPVEAGDELLGVLVVRSVEPGGLGQQDSEILQLVANQLATSIHTARAYAELRAQEQRELRVSRITQQIEQTWTAEEAIQVTIRELGRTLGAELSVGRVAFDSDSGWEALQ